MTTDMTTDLPRLSIRVGWIRHEILSALGAVDFLKSHQLYTMFKPKAKTMTSAQFIVHHVGILVTVGLVEEVARDEWALTVDGRLRLKELNAKVIDGPKVKKAAIPFSSETYKGPELRETCTRIGAYVAYGLPSRINGQLVPRKVANV